MPSSFINTLEAFMLVTAISMDAFVSSFAYGSNKIKIPFLSAQVIIIVCSSMFGLSLLAGSIFKEHIPSGITSVICFTILFILGVSKLLDSFTKSFIRKHNNLNKEIKFSMFNFRFILNLCANPVDADADLSKRLSPSEAASLAIALSLDGLAVGFGAALGNINTLEAFIYSLIFGAAAIMLGCRLGNKIAGALSFNLSWVGGILLIALAFFKL